MLAGERCLRSNMEDKMETWIAVESFCATPWGAVLSWFGSGLLALLALWLEALVSDTPSSEDRWSAEDVGDSVLIVFFGYISLFLVLIAAWLLLGIALFEGFCWCLTAVLNRFFAGKPHSSDHV